MDKRLLIGLSAVAGVGALVYVIRHNSASGTASPLIGGNAVGGSPQFGTGSADGGGNPFSAANSSPGHPFTSTTPCTNVSAPASPSMLSAITPDTITAAVIASNPLSVGSSVTTDKSLTQSMLGWFGNGRMTTSAGDPSVVAYIGK